MGSSWAPLGGSWAARWGSDAGSRSVASDEQSEDTRHLVKDTWLAWNLSPGPQNLSLYTEKLVQLLIHFRYKHILKHKKF